MHFYFNDAIAAAGFTPAPFYVKAETSLFIAFRLSVRRGGKQIPNLVKYAGISGWIGAGCSANGGLIDIYYFIQLFDPFDSPVSARNRPCSVQIFCQMFV